MAINPKEVEDIIYTHDQWVSSSREEWNRHRSAYGDKFWEQSGTRRKENDLQMQVNLIRPWVDSYVSSLFYKGLRTLVRADDLSISRFPEVARGRSEAIAAALDRWLATREATDLTEQAFTMGMLYPESAFKLGIDITTKSPLEAVYMEIMPPWECVWDRQSRTKRALRYYGHTYFISQEEYESRFGRSKDDPDMVAKPDVVGQGISGRPKERSEEKFVRILEFYDLTATHKVGETETEGEFRVYVLADGGVKRVFSGPMPYTTYDGRPMAPIIPIVLINTPEFPLQGISPVASLYELNAEVNTAHTYMAKAFRRDVNRVLLYLKDRGIDDEAISAILSGEDWTMAGVEAETLDGMMRWLEQQPISSTLLQYLELLEKGKQDTQGTAPFTRGEPLNYATATEVVRLNDYTETSLGRLRKRMDGVIRDVCALYLRVMSAAMDDRGQDSVFVAYEDSVYKLTQEDLERRWEVALADVANTPVAEQQRRQQFIQVQPLLMSLAEMVDQPGTMGAMAKAQLQYMQGLFDLPDDFRFDLLQSNAPAGPSPEAQLAEQELQGEIAIASGGQ